MGIVAYIRTFAIGDEDKCKRIMRALPAWFGIESAIVDYGCSLESLETYIAEIDSEVVGFLAIKHHNKQASEIHVMAVNGMFHGTGVGTQLLIHAEKCLKARSVEYLQVKTLGSSRPDSNYEITRAFYSSNGFRAIEETDLWGEANPCLILVKHLCCSAASK